MPSTVLAAYAVSIAAFVSALISTIIKPLLEAIPAFSPSRPDQRAHDALLRAVNLLLNVGGVLILAAAYHQLALENWLPIALQVALQALGSHALYQAITASPAVSASAPSDVGQPNAVKDSVS